MDTNKSHQTISEKNNITKLFLLFTIYQLVLHLYFSLSSNDPRLIIPTAIAFLHDIVLLTTITAVGHLLLILIPLKLKTIFYRIFLICFIIIGALLASYPKILREYLAFPVNIFNSDISSAEVLVSDYLGITALLPVLIALILGSAFLFFKIKVRISNRIKVAGFFIILIIFGFTLQRPSPQPFVFSLQQEIESLIKNERRSVPSLTRSYSRSEKNDNFITLTYSHKEITNYNHILLLVLEGVTSFDFEKEFLAISNGFYQQNKNHAVYYNNYYTTNLDSYTSLTSMVTAVQVPYRAYADENLFKNVNEAPSITQDLRNRGFYNIFISTYEYQPFVPTRSYWNKIYERKDLPTLEGWVSMGSNRMESATEDKAAISTIVDNMKTHEKTFILHEMVYGHSPEWRARTGKTQLSYYNEYLIELSKRLKEANLLSKTLFVIVSDHGDRAKSSEIDNYRIPLLVVGNGISFQSREELLTHLVLPKIIYHYVASDDHPVYSKEIFFVGSTEKWVYGKMNKQNEYLFIDDAAGTILSQKGRLVPIEVRNEFQNYLDGFNAKYGVK